MHAFEVCNPEQTWKKIFGLEVVLLDSPPTYESPSNLDGQDHVTHHGFLSRVRKALLIWLVVEPSL